MEKKDDGLDIFREMKDALGVGKHLKMKSLIPLKSLLTSWKKVTLNSKVLRKHTPIP